ncbi:MAG: (deoxy)nucleoside triphosphate pyrophosphohydrolase [Bacillota bacterium]|nr:(deoxy)nucleoside triphosphate pyrophosphohydrolase [Bacillota bacterium]
MDEIHVVGAAIRDGERILTAQRSEKMDEAMKWEFPGGKVEKNETHKEALKRELREELDIKVDVGEHIATGYSLKDDRKIVLHVYNANITSGRLVVKEHKQVKWIKVCDIMDMDWAEADVPACRKILENEGLI